MLAVDLCVSYVDHPTRVTVFLAALRRLVESLIIAEAGSLSLRRDLCLAGQTAPSRARAFPPRILALSASGIESEAIRSTVSYCPMS